MTYNTHNYTRQLIDSLPQHPSMSLIDPDKLKVPAAQSVVRFLLDTLSLARPANHSFEVDYITDVLEPTIKDACAYAEHTHNQRYVMDKDAYGNLWVTPQPPTNTDQPDQTTNTNQPDQPINGKYTEATTLITCHTDTANSSRYNYRPTKLATTSTKATKATTYLPDTPRVQGLMVTPTAKGKASVNARGALVETAPTTRLVIGLNKALPTSGCLGADDGAGIALAIAMLYAGKPYKFVFYRAEEVGGVGSGHSADYDSERYQHILRAIAFDRRGTGDIITYQSGGTCCSSTFASELAAMLSTSTPAITTAATKASQPATTTLAYEPSANGIFTDTANLIHLVPECTNVSVGYTSEHTDKETLDYTHWSALCERLVSEDCDFDLLPTERDPQNTYMGYTGKWFSSYLTGTGNRDSKRSRDYDYGDYYDRSYYDYDNNTGNLHDAGDATTWSDEEWIDLIRREGVTAAEELIWLDMDRAARLLTSLVGQ